MFYFKGKEWKSFALLALVPIAIMLWVWLSVLAFVPVPWPDDSAFYFVAKELFQWPPRWVMIPQAPFEPSYKIFNFNTMPLYPLLIGLGRFIGIDGSLALKFWPLSAWALTGVLLIIVLFRKGLPWVAALLVTLTLMLDPVTRWASVLVRPESLIGLFGLAIVLGLSFGFPKKFEARGLWDPVAALLALAAYAHFNAIHLLFAAVFGLAYQPFKAILKTAAKTALYLLPWFLAVIWHFDLFIQQMRTQFKRLAHPNDWLSTPAKALESLFQEMGNPDPWPPFLVWTGIGIWIVVFLAMIWGVLWPAIRKEAMHSQFDPSQSPNIIPAAGWIIGAIWLWSSKPEVWFIYYLHLSVWTFAGLAMLKFYKASQKKSIFKKFYISLILLLIPILIVFAYTDIRQVIRMGKSASWQWNTYKMFVDCVDQQLMGLKQSLGNPPTFRAWMPTFPDITIELSRRHPDWEFTRTNDFWERNSLALRHAKEVDAVVVTETLRSWEYVVTARASQYPALQSIWMNWKGYYLYPLLEDPAWKPNRFICARGRWLAFLYMEEK